MGHEQGYKTDRTRDVWALEFQEAPLLSSTLRAQG